MFRTLKSGMLAAAALVMGLPLGACTNSGVSALPPAPKSAPQTVYELKAGLVAAEIAAETYENSVCQGTVPCSAPGAVTLNSGIMTTDALIKVAETAVRSGSDATSAIAAAQTALSSLQVLVTQYAAKNGSTAS